MTPGPAGVSASQYLDPQVDLTRPRVRLRVVDAREPAVSHLAIVVDDPDSFDVPITPWPVSGRRVLDPGTGVEGGSTEGDFTCTWEGRCLLAVNQAVGGSYVIAFAGEHGAGEHGDGATVGDPRSVLLWHVNFHPDGGQLFWSPDGAGFLVPAAPVGEDPDSASAVALYSDGTFGICLPAGVWHDGVYPLSSDGRFMTRQGRVHARVSADLGAEFGVLWEVPLIAPSPR